jgi:hypothetical protein
VDHAAERRDGGEVVKDVFITSAHYAHLLHREYLYPVVHYWHQLWAVILPF